MTVLRQTKPQLYAALPKCTARQYYALPAGGPQFQLIDSVLHMMAPSPGFSHQNSSLNLSFILKLYAKKHKLGIVLSAPMDVEFDSKNIFQPDILFLSNDRRDRIEEKRIKGAPDLVVEILSPSTKQIDRLAKRPIYQSSGVREVWEIDTGTKTLVIHDYTDSAAPKQRKYTAGDLVTTPVMPGMEFQLQEIFEVDQ